MALSTLWLVFSISMLASASPGPVMLNCMTVSARYGSRAALRAALGGTTGNILLIAISALSLATLLHAIPALLQWIKYLGGAYLFYLGVRLFLAAPQATDATTPPPSGSGHFRQAFFIAISNPKGLVYFGALFPQFINADAPLLTQYLWLASLVLVIDMMWMSVYMTAGRAITGWLANERHARRFNQVMGGIFIGLALLLIGHH